MLLNEIETLCLPILGARRLERQPEASVSFQRTNNGFFLLKRTVLHPEDAISTTQKIKSYLLSHKTQHHHGAIIVNERQ
jgi:hypothetical protein